MIFALLIAAIIWNLGTWALGMPELLVPRADRLDHGRRPRQPADGAEPARRPPASTGARRINVFQALLFSPLVGFILAALLLLIMKFAGPEPEALRRRRRATRRRRCWIRGLLILTCTGVSFAHGGNDGQKGMGLIMLILIGAAPTAYALNRTMPDSATPAFVGHGEQAAQACSPRMPAAQPAMPVAAGRAALVGDALRDKKRRPAAGLRRPRRAVRRHRHQVKNYGAISPGARRRRRPTCATTCIWRATPSACSARQGRQVSTPEAATLKAYKSGLDKGTRFIPTWVKVCVAIALGLGTMVGWKRIVVTVGERIGKTHLTYAQGASAEMVAAATIGARRSLRPAGLDHPHPVQRRRRHHGGQRFGPAVGHGERWRLAWVLTLPAAITISACLFYIFRHLF